MHFWATTRGKWPATMGSRAMGLYLPRALAAAVEQELRRLIARRCGCCGVLLTPLFTRGCTQRCLRAWRYCLRGPGAAAALLSMGQQRALAACRARDLAG